MDALINRRAMRKFDRDHIVEAEKIEKIRKAIENSPSALAKFPLKFHIITGEKAHALGDAVTPVIQKMMPRVSERQKSLGFKETLFYDAPLVIVITQKNLEENPYVELDAGIALGQIMDAASVQGLSSIPVGLIKVVADQAHEIYGISKEEKIIVATGIGYGLDTPSRPPRPEGMIVTH